LDDYEGEFMRIMMRECKKVPISKLERERRRICATLAQLATYLMSEEGLPRLWKKLW